MPTNSPVTAVWTARRDAMMTFAAEHPTFPYTQTVERLGFNKATDIETVSAAFFELASIDLRHWQGDEFEKERIIEAREQLSKLSAFLYRRHWFQEEEA